ncbi:MAG: hypothetical protein Q8S73_01870 [Deltaproteobacteria bacterium]|nr:hypothetical protein [Myxococcales bacterium]MDP3212823.1 hypothetical protein [Deltaproteobacteria bacterium]
MSFVEKVRDAVKVEGEEDTSQSKAYLRVIEELAQGLETPGISARVQRSRDPRRVSLRVFPEYRPQSGIAMLTFLLEGASVTVLGDRPETLTSPESLEQWLLENFVTLPTFKESLQVFREQATKPVEARLRVSEVLAFSKGDVVVSVSADDQKKIGDAAVGQEVRLPIRRVDFPGNAAFDQTGMSYVILDSAGLLLSVKGFGKFSDEQVTLTGLRRESPLPSGA